MENGSENPLSNPGSERYKLLEFRDGHFWFPDGTLATPDVEIGLEEYHRQLFIEYEISFGRGKAKFMTHSGMPGQQILSLHGEAAMSYLSDYQTIASEYVKLIKNGSQAEIRILTSKIKEYREKYPWLYEE